MIDWAAFAVVALTALISASLVVSLFAFGLRLLNVGRGADAEDASDTVRQSDTKTVAAVPAMTGGRPVWATAVAVACFSLCGIAVCYGIYLIVPFFHT